MPKEPKKNASADAEIRKKMTHRLARIEGQLRGVRRMIEGGKPCVDVITQVTAIKAAVSILGMELLKNDLLCRRREGKSIDDAYLKALFTLK